MQKHLHSASAQTENAYPLLIVMSIIVILVIVVVVPAVAVPEVPIFWKVPQEPAAKVPAIPLLGNNCQPS